MLNKKMKSRIPPPSHFEKAVFGTEEHMRMGRIIKLKEIILNKVRAERIFTKNVLIPVDFSIEKSIVDYLKIFFKEEFCWSLRFNRKDFFFEVSEL